MNKKLMAVAVAGALTAPAVAMAQSTVQVYGNLYIEYAFTNQKQSASGTGLTQIDRVDADILQTGGSAIGFKGEEKLGGGMSAWFQCESTADPRGASQDGWCSRNSAVGLKGGFGNFFVGKVRRRSSTAPPKACSGVGRTTPSTTTARISADSRSWRRPRAPTLRPA
ncbi:MAG: outer membrane protein (porin) [Proteobacteria bacterium]|nr:outer membrane protein (porin) [Pseudomonadota bacterium]